MSEPFTYSTTYKLDKSHFSETFDESVIVDGSLAAYFKALVFIGLGAVVLVATEVNPYAAWFIVGLGIVEALSVRFRKSWWLARQMLSRAANNELTLTIDDNGVSTKSFNVESHLSWLDMTQIEPTQQGWLLHHSTGKNYISNRCLSEGAQGFIRAKASLTSKK